MRKAKSRNPYSPPAKKAAAAGKKKKRSGPLFHPVSLRKLGVMGPFTINIYLIYWFFQNWRYAQKKKGWILPVVFAFFFPLTCYGIFEKVQTRALKCKIPVGWSVVSLGLACTTIQLLPLLLSAQGVPYTELIKYLMVLPLLPVQKTINQLNAQERDVATDRFGLWSILFAVLGGLVMIGEILWILLGE